MRVLVTGAKGQLGTEVCAAYADVELISVDIDRVDLRDTDAVHALIADETRPDLVVNTAAAHNVPECEKDPATAFAVNAAAVRAMAAACRACGARMVHISTDYVFGSGGKRPYVETDLPAPLNVYAASKLAGEFLLAAECPDHVILRTAALYGHAPCVAKGGKNFVQLMLHLAATRPEIRVVTDEITTPTYTRALAAQIRLVAEKGKPGLYHATCNGECSWYDFAKAIFEETNTSANLLPATSADFPSPVKRPNYSVLCNKRLQDQGIDIMPHWRDALRAYVRAEQDAR
ncbi:MAG TPA: dTDP-4-dehydrorhamnose reductase [Candidatus Hydrogenedentes bacterium]|nr:dTDP-4-dehydrorhamnose reductase [Candidatus Hydrogenedentota bacterium]HPC16633.1 dTDP-4-dehydrorhamnose reductase [Candidatus Hydrogenedentota bacterium]HRT22127.1 dTDP-4-dehydrorhamnose reductase [Candidatus Hydrogenedentota bacterium]HRT63484.1 dTDP-4-dehydrorhamnose reductase [Candidatus Hydrogenedentota bacterium]